MSEEKKTHAEHKYSVTLVSKVGTITKLFNISPSILQLGVHLGGYQKAGNMSRKLQEQIRSLKVRMMTTIWFYSLKLYVSMFYRNLYKIFTNILMDMFRCFKEILQKFTNTFNDMLFRFLDFNRRFVFALID